MSTQGVIVGTDQNTAWLLPWWWENYSAHNRFPVTFVDFGLGAEELQWCQERGQLLSFHQRDFIKDRQDIDPHLAQEWEHLYGRNVWQARKGWFCKPFSMLLSPYDIGLWMDLDCEVCAPLEPLFQSLSPYEISIAKDPGRPGIHNSGVILFKKDTPILSRWATACIEENHLWIGDDYILSALLAADSSGYKELPEMHHRLAGTGLEPATIIHWASNWGKLFIETHGGYQKYLRSLQNITPNKPEPEIDTPNLWT